MLAGCWGPKSRSLKGWSKSKNFSSQNNTTRRGDKHHDRPVCVHLDIRRIVCSPASTCRAVEAAESRGLTAADVWRRHVRALQLESRDSRVPGPVAGHRITQTERLAQHPHEKIAAKQKIKCARRLAGAARENGSSTTTTTAPLFEEPDRIFVVRPQPLHSNARHGLISGGDVEFAVSASSSVDGSFAPSGDVGSLRLRRPSSDRQQQPLLSIAVSRGLVHLLARAAGLDLAPPRALALAPPELIVHRARTAAADWRISRHASAAGLAPAAAAAAAAGVVAAPLRAARAPTAPAGVVGGRAVTLCVRPRAALARVPHPQQQQRVRHVHIVDAGRPAVALGVARAGPAKPAVVAAVRGAAVTTTTTYVQWRPTGVRAAAVDARVAPGAQRRARRLRPRCWKEAADARVPVATGVRPAAARTAAAEHGGLPAGARVLDHDAGPGPPIRNAAGILAATGRRGGRSGGARSRAETPRRRVRAIQAQLAAQELFGGATWRVAGPAAAAAATAASGCGSVLRTAR